MSLLKKNYIRRNNYIFIQCNKKIFFQVGVAILANAPEKIEKKPREEARLAEIEPLRRTANRPDAVADARVRLRKAMKQLEEEDQPQLVRLGDASVAAPFTSRLSSILCSKYSYVFSFRLSYIKYWLIPYYYKTLLQVFSLSVKVTGAIINFQND